VRVKERERERVMGEHKRDGEVKMIGCRDERKNKYWFFLANCNR